MATVRDSILPGSREIELDLHCGPCIGPERIEQIEKTNRETLVPPGIKPIKEVKLHKK